MTFVGQVISALVAALWASLARPLPTRASCPPGWWLPEGVSRHGHYTCWRAPVGQDHRDPDGIVRDASVLPKGEIVGNIYCTGGQVPIVVDYRTVGCQARH